MNFNLEYQTLPLSLLIYSTKFFQPKEQALTREERKKTLPKHFVSRKYLQ